MPRQSTTLKDGRPATYRNRVSDRIKATMIVDRLQKCVLGELTLTTSQVQAARILLDRVVPAVKPVDISQDHNSSKDIRNLSPAEVLSIIDGKS